ncbi:phage antirepressor KilAC domain-containing protein [Weissella thailandensis]|uniref:Phage repressor protein/antirepressor Ant n=1 Tax=Weissella thailandensis TaxID=89061 RepID=A0ABX9IAW2_9LACO|nr:phage antirepressor KilAC domain-containing protein [Weissella thailandensis]NKY90340.1 phage repressor protein/antirepressor Ant [Weissella thailandensis]RDS60431.1 phage repressor protein/antirepressor Ant [Weissella thailandensis]GEP75667.1 hypothetical protein WTH01_19140 [Weissella thailandensis]
MSNEVQVFDNLKVKEVNGQVMFDAESAAIGLGIFDKSHGYENVRWERVNKYLKLSATSGGKINKGDFITEPQFYRLAIKANNETAERFQAWVTEEVLPSIRKHGAYLTNDKIEEILLSPDTLIKVATELKNEREKNVLLTQQVSESRPKADYYDKIMQSKSLVTITQIAKDYGWSAKQMNDKLHELGVQYKIGGQWVLYSKYQDKGYTFSTTVDITKKDGSSDVRMNTKWTQKGRVFIYNLLKENDILPTIEREN